MELLLSGLRGAGICEKMNIDELPAVLSLYLICSPALDLKMRFLPRGGGYYNQYYVDMKWFRVIESQIINYLNREAERAKSKHGR